MKFLHQTWGAVVFAIKRISSQPGLALAMVLSISVAIALTMSVPIYADAVYHYLFSENVLLEDKESFLKAQPIKRPSFFLLFRYLDSPDQGKRWEELKPLNDFLSQRTSIELGLRGKMTVHFMASTHLGLYPVTETDFIKTPPLVETNFASLSGIGAHIELLEGSLPVSRDSATDRSVDILISEQMSNEMGLQVGEHYLAVQKYIKESQMTLIQIPVRIAGVWRASNPEEPYWYIQPDALQKQMLVTEDVFIRQVDPILPQCIPLSSWYLVMDESSIRYQDALLMIGRIKLVELKAVGLLRNLSLEQSPVKALQQYQERATLLMVQLYAISIPVLGLILTFISLTAGLAVEQKRNEIAVVRSRGAMVIQMIEIALFESLLLSVVGFALSLPISLGAAKLIGRSLSFLHFSSPVSLPVKITGSAIILGVAGVCLAVLSQIAPTISASTLTIVSYKQEQARILRKPWWQRAWLDLFLLLVASYGTYLLRQQGAIALMGSRDPFENPLLFLIPSITILSITLLFCRVMPYLMDGITWVVDKTPSVGILMAARHLSRSPNLYVTPLILLVLTLSLSGFTTSLADTMDRQLYDQVYYQVGSDLSFLDEGLNVTSGSLIATPNTLLSILQPQENTSNQEITKRKTGFLPISEYTRFPGVIAGTRVGQYAAGFSIAGTNETAIFLGIDRVDFPKVAFWRNDFSEQSLGELMNALALTPDGVLIPQSAMNQEALNLGDVLQVSVADDLGINVRIPLKIVGSFRLFPGWYPDQGILLVGNLDQLFEAAGGQYPYRVWFKTSPGADLSLIGEQTVRAIKIRLLNWQGAMSQIRSVQQSPDRQGLLGLLSVGFLAAAILTVIGFFLFALFSFQRRFIEMGILRAIGLSATQMASFLACELAFLILMGVAVGTGLGVGASRLFIPFFQVGSGARALIPPYMVKISWVEISRVYALFGLMFIFAFASLVVLLRRIKIFQAIKLGESY